MGGACVAVVGLAMRAWAAGSIDKGATLATGGPYAYTRNPLYLGSFVIGIGIALAGAHWAWLVAFTLFFVIVYVPTMRREAAELIDRFGERYRDYSANVPAFSWRLSPYRQVAASSTGSPSGGFTWSRYRRYREWEAALGVLLVFGVLVSRLALLR